MSKPVRKVGIVGWLSHAGGVQSCILALAQEFNRRGVVPELIWPENAAVELIREAGVQLTHCRIQFPISRSLINATPDSVRHALRIFNVYDGRRIAANYERLILFYNGFLVPSLCPHVYYISGPPIIRQLQTPPVGMRGLPFRLIQFAYRRALRYKWPAFDLHRDRRYAINSDFTASLFEREYGKKIPVVYPPVRFVNLEDQNEEDLDGRDSVVFFSRIVSYKRPELILELAKANSNLRFVVMGGVTDNRRAYFTSLKKRAASEGLPVVFRDNPKKELVRQELGRARVYFFGGVNEHFGMTTVEAVAEGALPMVHDSGGQRDIVPIKELRFKDEELHARFRELWGLTPFMFYKYRQELRRHIRRFTADEFYKGLMRVSEIGPEDLGR